jgi:hypothetical protein
MTKKAPTGIRSTAPLALFNIANNFAIRHHNGRNRTTAPNGSPGSSTSTSQRSTWCSGSSNETQVTPKTRRPGKCSPGIGRPD